MLTAKQLMEAQASDVLCQNFKEVLRKDGRITVNEDGLLCRKVPTDEAIQILVSESFRRTLLYHEACLPLPGHPGMRQMYSVLRRTNYWPHMASGVDEFVLRCASCSQHSPSQTYHR